MMYYCRCSRGPYNVRIFTVNEIDEFLLDRCVSYYVLQLDCYLSSDIYATFARKKSMALV